ncbi:DEAD/DEAH box helicase family protein [Conexibacter sp. JD483]|uniref:DEAD/DEAH box helicase family protein n=1 Tax=unclassified Conexibacter TaxID=2627773 RepID=UPI00271E024B|nr:MULTISPECIES: DEAD/DEAH box helicase family protein [unclassified Conexibacter]MDO8186591.1 DEAD/DEAH box helicase family protein [Conexibacter sp. CPCC 205706]MDO8196696.1 DEAD/DEAH box helicase family protein [Conexibacter sp. CPCC 205762]MDR9371807.1 DEAD/DEAH box helicase family protein [Conexibacter sp. JD483]
MTATSDGWSGLAFTPAWRHYQQLALAAFDADVAARRRATHIVAPPGSGKTVIGLEIARRLGRPALVLCPTSAIRAQWGSALALFGGGDAVPLHAHTYQAICQTADPGGALAEAALGRLAAERARDTAVGVDAARAEMEAWEGAARRRLQRDVATVTASLKREIARGGELGLAAHDLLGDGARARLAELQAAGVRTVLLDECHHLVSTWGYLVRAVIAALGDDVHVVGLTATSPADLSGEEAVLYDDLLGEVDFEIPTPAVVKEGYLAPYQELALFTTPLASERAWLREHHVRFQELLDRLQTPAPIGSAEEELSFGAWTIARMRYRDAEAATAFAAAGDPGSGAGAGGDAAGVGDGEDAADADAADAGAGIAGAGAAEPARLSFAAFAKRQPRLARAGLRYLASGGLELPPDAPRGELTRAPLELDDWLVLLDDWALRCLRAHPGDAAERLWQQLADGLADLGYALTRRGIRPGRDDLDRVLVHSAAKSLLVVDALDAEHGVRGEALRGVVLCDSERPARAPESTSLTLGGGLALLRAIAADTRTELLAPLLVTGTTVACAVGDHARWREALAAELPQPLAALLTVEPLPGAGGDVPLVRLTAAHPDWTTATWVPAVTRAFAAAGANLPQAGAHEDRTIAPLSGGRTSGGRDAERCGRVLIGTRALLGEGWDCPPVNVLIDCTAVAASVSVRQMRGRSLRLDPADGGKIASNWDVVCVDPELERGTADYQRFVRRHAHLHAPCEDGSIESGVSHVHPQLSPYAPPPEQQFTALNLAALDRAAGLDAARERWRIGAPYRGEELPVLLVASASSAPGSASSVPAIATSARGNAQAAPRSASDAPASASAAPWAAAFAPARPLPSSGRGTGSGAIVALVLAVVAGLTANPAAAVGMVCVALVLAGLALHQATLRGRVPTGPPALERTARAVAEAYVALGEIAPASAASLAFAPRLGGRIRVALAAGTSEENRRFAGALEEAIGSATAHRYLVSRPLPRPAPGTRATRPRPAPDHRATRPRPAFATRATAAQPHSALSTAIRAARAIAGREQPELHWHPVPSDLGRNRARADAYANAWRAQVAPEGTLQYTGGSEEGRALLLRATDEPAAYAASHRTLWV